MTKQNWTAVDITVDARATEAVEYAFNAAEALGTEINDFRKDKTGDLCVVGYFDYAPDDLVLGNAIGDALRIFGLDSNSIKSTAIRQVENADWLAEWKKHWKPTRIGKFIIAPPWSIVDETADIVIRIEPNMAFGTGTHETTQLCLQAIEQNYRKEHTFLDVGTGTGILAIAAAKMFDGAQEVSACDTDAAAVEIANENAARNGVSIKFIHGSITKATPVFDFACANLTIDVIVPLLPLLLEKTRLVLVLSGILAEQEDTMARELEKLQVSNLKFEIKGEWMSAVISSG